MILGCREGKFPHESDRLKKLLCCLYSWKAKSPLQSLTVIRLSIYNVCVFRKDDCAIRSIYLKHKQTPSLGRTGF